MTPLLFIDIDGIDITSEEIELIQHPLVAGIILFSRNFYDREQLKYLIQSLRKNATHPLLIAVDQEGGRVQRFRKGFSTLPAMQSISALINDPNEQHRISLEIGWQMASEMTALDIDISFAPVLDLGHQCIAIGDRSFHSDPDDVIRLATQFIQGMHQAGLPSVGKHFPGHGYVSVDSHIKTPYDHRSYEDLLCADLLPFQQLIRRNLLDSIMPAHVIYPKCDMHPASGSSYWLKDILRCEFKFDGVIFSDDLGMKGAEFMGNFTQRCQQSLSAGCDILLLCNERQGVIDVLDHFRPQESERAIQQRQHRLKQLQKFKLSSNNTSWSDLISSPRWKHNHRELARLQAHWLERN